MKVYYSETCRPCHALMEWLDEKGIEYEKIVPGPADAIYAVPTTEIDNVRIKGLDRHTIALILRDRGIEI